MTMPCEVHLQYISSIVQLHLSLQLQTSGGGILLWAGITLGFGSPASLFGPVAVSLPMFLQKIQKEYKKFLHEGVHWCLPSHISV